MATKACDTLSSLKAASSVYRCMVFASAAALLVSTCGGAPNSRSQSASGNGAEAPPAPSASRVLAAPGEMDGGAIAPSTVKEQLPPEVIQQIVRANFGRMRECYEEGLRRDPTLRGKIATRFVIERDGSVSTAADIHDVPPAQLDLPENVPLGEFDRRLVAEPRFPDPKVTECVVSIFKALVFPRPQAGIVTVVYPVILAPGE